MNNQHEELNELGWSDWFAQRAECATDETIARVAAVDRAQLLVVNHSGPFRAKLAGSYLLRHPISHERPCVGDWVCLEKPHADNMGVVQSLIGRKTFLRRKLAGTAIGYQMIAANLDTAVIVQSCHYDFNLNRLKRYLIMVAEGGAETAILLTKTDLVAADVLAAQQAEIRTAGITAPILTLSNLTGEGIEEIKGLLLPGKTYCFVGSSGVGKSTLINHLIGWELQATKTVSQSGEGRHATVRRELIRLDGGAMVIDNPGMREFGLVATQEGIGSKFADITARASACRFRDCSHSGEPDCAVQKALLLGEISSKHFESYRKLLDESVFHALSPVEKRKKDRNFGKFIKSNKNDLKDW